jgi:hypothetical protein
MVARIQQVYHVEHAGTDRDPDAQLNQAARPRLGCDAKCDVTLSEDDVRR